MYHSLSCWVSYFVINIMHILENHRSHFIFLIHISKSFLKTQCKNYLCYFFNIYFKWFLILCCFNNSNPTYFPLDSNTMLRAVSSEHLAITRDLISAAAAFSELQLDYNSLHFCLDRWLTLCKKLIFYRLEYICHSIWFELYTCCFKIKTYFNFQFENHFIGDHSLVPRNCPDHTENNHLNM